MGAPAAPARAPPQPNGARRRNHPTTRGPGRQPPPRPRPAGERGRPGVWAGGGLLLRRLAVAVRHRGRAPGPGRSRPLARTGPAAPSASARTSWASSRSVAAGPSGLAVCFGSVWVSGSAWLSVSRPAWASDRPWLGTRSADTARGASSDRSRIAPITASSASAATAAKPRPAAGPSRTADAAGAARRRARRPTCVADDASSISGRPVPGGRLSTRVVLDPRELGRPASRAQPLQVRPRRPPRTGRSAGFLPAAASPGRPARCRHPAGLQDRNRLGVHVRGQHLVRRTAEGRTAREQLVQHAAQRVPVTGRDRRLAADLLGGDVRGRAEQHLAGEARWSPCRPSGRCRSR